MGIQYKGMLGYEGHSKIQRKMTNHSGDKEMWEGPRTKGDDEMEDKVRWKREQLRLKGRRTKEDRKT